MVKFAIDNPVKVTVAILLLLLFGGVSLRTMPVQMKPTVDKPEISVNTNYPGAAPAEIEEQVTIPIEERLQAVEGLRRLTSSSREGRSSVELEFDWGVDKDVAVVDIIKRLARVRKLPDDADEPIVVAGATSERRPIYWANMQGAMPVDKMRRFANDVIAPRFERIPGVAEVRVYGGEEREIQVVADFAALALRGLTLRDLITALANENVNVRGGAIDIGKRRYQVRTVGLFKSPEDIENVIVSKDNKGAPVYVRDVATVYDTFKERSAMVRVVGRPSVVFGIVRKSDANTIEVVRGVETTMAKLNEEIAPKGVKVFESYDSSDYIWESITFVTSNFIIGALLAVSILLLFLRSWRSTLVIGVAIPIVTAAGFILLNVFGRSLNIISLAGMAFAVGMVVDNSIVALENIYRHLAMGKDRSAAALDGASEVWGAILASTLTTLAVFVPIIYVEEEAGQLFGDIAIAISVSVGASLVVAITVIPSMSARFMAHNGETSNFLLSRLTPINRIGKSVWEFFVNIATWLMASASKKIRIALIMVIVLLSFSTFFLAPKMEYLPKGNRNLIFVIFKPHVGTNMDAAREYSDKIADRILKLPEVKYMFHVVSSRFNGIGVRLTKENRLRIAEVEAKINKTIQGVPGFQFYRAFQTSLFSRLTGSDIEIEVRGLDLNQIAAYSQQINGQLFGVDGVSFSRSNLESGAPEFQVKIDRERAADLGLRVIDVAEVVEALVAGKKATLYKEGGDEYDITVRGDKSLLTDGDAIRAVTLYGANGKAVRLDSIAEVIETVGPSQINHIELDRSVTLSVTKKNETPLQQVIENIERDVLNPLREKLPTGYHVTLSGSAADLERTANELSGSLLLAVVIVYLLMAALFESWLMPLIIMFSAPLAAAGAILGIVLTGSKLDVLTMLGFVILTGVVVNNAILLIHQTMNNRRHNMLPKDAMIEAVKVRIRPIFMSSMTTALGMLPLVIRGGAGSELYSGLGAAIVGGLAISTIFTLILIPAIYSLVEDV